MDLVKNTDEAVKIYESLNHHQKRVLIDAQNCCGETALWRSMFHGRMDCSKLLLEENANTVFCARVQESPADSVSLKENWLLISRKKIDFRSLFQFIGSYGFRPFGFNAQLLKKRSVIKSLPALFAPLLFDSPCISTEREKFGEQNETLRVCMLDKFFVSVYWLLGVIEGGGTGIF